MNTRQVTIGDRAGRGGVVASMLASPECVQQLWLAQADDPLTGVLVVTESGAVLYANDVAARVMLGAQASVADMLASSPSDWGSDEYLAERLRLLHDVLRDGKVRIFRSICAGLQVLATVRRVRFPDAAGVIASTLFITTRSIPGDPRTLVRSQADAEYREATSVDFGPLSVLSRRELQVLALIGQGKSMPEAAVELGLSVHTVQDHRKAIGKKLGVDDRVRLAQIAHSAGLRLDDALRTRFEPRRVRHEPSGHASLPAYQ